MANANFINIPDGLKNERFCLWKYETVNGKSTKVPYNPKTGGKAQSTNASTFDTFDNALKEYERTGKYSGLGVGVFGDLVGVDIDHCINDGKLTPHAEDIIKRLDTYTEISPSGTGLRLFGRASGFQYGDQYYKKNPDNGTEVYVAGNTGRFLTVTGDVINKKPVRDVSEKLPALLERYMKRPERKKADTTPAPVNMGDAELIEKIRASEQGRLFDQLMAGDTTGYNSQSEADLSLCNILAFWTGRDANRIDSIFRTSGLYRGKWDEKHGVATYGEQTVTKAIEGCMNVYEPNNTQTQPAHTQPVTSQRDESGKIKLKRLCDIQQTEVSWLIPSRIPKGEVCLFAGEGGTGKTTTVCDLIAGITTGRKSFLESDSKVPVDEWETHEVGEVLYFSSEDDFSKVLVGRLKQHGADLTKIQTIETTDDDFKDLSFNSEILEQIIAEYKPTLCVFDPIQSFIPSEVNMSARNEMRNCMNPLVQLGHKYGTTFVILMHTNKKRGAWGRYRLADSSDLWDIARSILMFGYADRNGTRYVSHEKCSYGKSSTTLLFNLDEGKIKFKGTSSKTDYDFVSETDRQSRSAPVMDATKEFIIDQLTEAENHLMKVSELDEVLKACDHKDHTIKNAKTQLVKEGKIKIYNTGYGKEKVHWVKLYDKVQ